MKIAKDRIVCIDYTIRLASGRTVETSVGQEPLTYIHGRRQIVPGVERAIEGLEAGSLLETVVAPADAYGERDPNGVFVVPRGAFPEGEDVGPGMMFSASRPDGKNVVFRVLQAEDELVLVDTNHPLAGETLHISIRIHTVRSATVDEIYSGRVLEPAPMQQHYLC
ncbi:MAG TPA: peptidylprolyl isomerase [Polyangia bacterium]|nr:peptidylprolyl isomerase [Polyangia bacterium]HWE27132.1 peptidylprolyl isomerase [Polyangia bacterium]